VPFIRSFLWIGGLSLGAILGGVSMRWWMLGKDAYEPRPKTGNHFRAALEPVENPSAPAPPYVDGSHSGTAQEFPGNENENPNTTDRSTPIPSAWEPALKAALGAEDPALRNLALVHLATATAAHVPRVQAECLAHLTYGLEETDFRQFLALANNPILPLETRAAFVETTLEIRTPEFSGWFAQQIVRDGDPALSKICQDYLAQKGEVGISEEGSNGSPF